MTGAIDDTATAAPRPASLDPHDLGFTPRRPVPWLGPILLAATGARVLLAQQFGAYLDKRELQNAFPSTLHDHSQEGDVWLDYVADVGDGFNATYSIAYLMAQPELSIGDHTLPRADIVVMGGDQVYPTASGAAYDDRFKGPYRAAFPVVPPGEVAPTLYALPGNHDWYDGLTAFLRVFARQDGARIGGWRTAQTRSYFALRLPQRWWLFAIDAQPGAYLDDPQLAYFREVATQVRAGDRVIVCTPTPAWVKSAEIAEEYDTTDYFVRKIIAPTGATVSLMLSGDLHHYARYSNTDRHLITAGGGGAYLYPTHRLPKRLQVPPRASIVRRRSAPDDYRLSATYPSAPRSRALGAGVFARLPLRNPGFVALLGLVQTMLLLAIDNTKHQVFTFRVGFMIAGIFALTMFFSAGLTASGARFRHYLIGAVHGVTQVGLGIAGLLIWQRLAFDDLEWPLPALSAAAVYGPVIAVAATQLVAAYLVIASQFGVNLNELFAGQGIEHFKGFLRMRFGADGSLTIYPIGVDRVGRRWRAAPQAPTHAPWIEPAKPLRPRFMEPPVTL